MSDFTHNFWSLFVTIVTVVSILACLVLLIASGQVKTNNTADNTTGHVWDEDLREMNNPLPRWWKWMFILTIVFALAYLISASACVLLIGFYVCHVLRSVAHGLGFSAGLAALYGLLYGLLSAEDYALLMGSLLLFGLLGTVMVLTRKLDWYGVGKRKVEQGQ